MYALVADLPLFAYADKQDRKAKVTFAGATNEKGFEGDIGALGLSAPRFADEAARQHFAESEGRPYYASGPYQLHP